MDLPEGIIKGGKNGKTIVLQNPFESELIKRIYLPMNDEHHMPPKEQSQITPAEVQLLQWWIGEGASFDKKVNQTIQTQAIQAILKGLEAKRENAIFSNNDIPDTKIGEVSDSLIQRLRKMNIAIVPVGDESNYLSVSFAALPLATDDVLELLYPLKKNIIWLKLGGTKISDNALHHIGTFENLTRLSLDHTAITDAGLMELKNLKNLRYLNLANTSISIDGFIKLKSLSNLTSVYLYQTQIKKEDWIKIADKFPKVEPDFGDTRFRF